MNTDLLVAISELDKLGYKFESVLGKGAFGVVLKAYQMKPSKLVAIKILDISKVRDLSSIKRELEVMQALNHENIVKLLDTHYTTSRIYVVLEFCGAGDLFGYVQSRGFLPEELALSMFRQLVNAVEHSHKQGYVHRDIKLENVLLTYDGVLKLADWGFARSWTSNSTISNEFPGSLLYASPEIVSGTPYYGPEIDVWSMGVTLFAIATGCMPFAGPNNQITADRIRAGCYPIPASLSKNLRDLLEKIFDPNPKFRFTIEDIKQHPWFTCRTQSGSCLQKVRSRSFVSTPRRGEDCESKPTSIANPSVVTLSSSSSSSTSSVLSGLESSSSADKEASTMGPSVAAFSLPKSSKKSSKKSSGNSLTGLFRGLWQKTRRHSNTTRTLF